MYNYDFIERTQQMKINIIKKLFFNSKFEINFNDYLDDFEKLYAVNSRILSGDQKEEFIKELTRIIRYIYYSTNIKCTIDLNHNKITLIRRNRANFKLFLQYVLLILF